MSGSNLPLPRTNATTDDCGRLWSTLTDEYIPRLQILLKFEQDTEFGTVLRMEIVDDGPEGPDGAMHQNVWASATYFNQLHLITSSRLFDLLIVAHKRIDDFFTHGERFAPDRRQV
jgi:hypothetical protein